MSTRQLLQTEALRTENTTIPAGRLLVVVITPAPPFVRPTLAEKAAASRADADLDGFLFACPSARYRQIAVGDLTVIAATMLAHCCGAMWTRSHCA